MKPTLAVICAYLLLTLTACQNDSCNIIGMCGKANASVKEAEGLGGTLAQEALRDLHAALGDTL